MKNINIDNGQEFDWGRTSKDYGKYREGYPDSYFKKLECFGIGLPSQNILDIGTGTGVLARQFAKNECRVTGSDISENQISEAIRLSEEQKIKAEWIVCAAENMNIDNNTFDVITAAQCWQYFDYSKLIPEILNILKPNGLLMYSFFAWLPLEDKIASKTEELILKYNPKWQGAGYTDHKLKKPDWINGKFDVETMHKYNEFVPFTRESWRGRIRACRGIGASLSDQEVLLFDAEHDKLLKDLAGDSFNILYQTWIYVLRKLEK